ncbi:MAG: hypothetical protein J7480_02255 [Microbacteriaceae bacterium]|nr:hypothetical protein [Microbacteriaceae bacterium]
MSECRHGLELELCDICSPKAPAAPAPRPAATPRSRPATPASGGAHPPRAGERGAAAARSAAPGIAVHRGEGRRYLTADLGELAAWLTTSDIEDWSWHAPEGVAKDRVVIVGNADRVVQFIAVANEPARRVARETLDGAGHALRVIVQPGWF